MLYITIYTYTYIHAFTYVYINPHFIKVEAEA